MHTSRVQAYLFSLLVIVVILSPTVNLAIPQEQGRQPTRIVPQSSPSISTSDVERYTPDHPNPSIQHGTTPSSVSGKHIVMFHSFAARDNALEILSESAVRHVYDYIPAIVTVSEDLDLSSVSGIRSVTPDFRIQSSSASDQVDLAKWVQNAFTLDETSQMIGVDVLQDQLGLTGDGVTIGILDSGINKSLNTFDSINLDVVSELSDRGAVDEDGHGTHVAGIAASNGRYFIDGQWQDTDSPGMAPGATIQSIRVLDETGYGDNSWILEGMELAINKSVDIISMSLSTVIYEGVNDPMQQLVYRAIEKGILVVAAAGNTGPIGSAIGIPGALDGVIGVGGSFARDIDDKELWSFSGIGPSTNGYPGADLLAPGAKIISINSEDGGFTQLSGTSMATPHISGGIALLKQAFPTATISQIREALLATAQISINQAGLVDQVEGQGRGHVRFDLAYNMLLNTVNENPDSHVQMPIIPNIIQDRNYVYNHRLIDQNKTLPFFIHSSRNITIEPVVNQTFSDGLTFFLPDQINLTTGVNRINITLHVTADSVRPARAQLYFIESSTSKLLPNAYLFYDAETRYVESRVLFDTAHDGDTAAAYFGNHGPRGQYSQFEDSAEEQGHIVHQSGNQTITSSLLDDYDLLVIANPDREYSSSEIDVIQDFVEEDGKSMLVIVGGGLLSAEGEPTYPDFNRADLNSILARSSITIPEDTTTPFSLSQCNFDTTDYDTRSSTCLDTARFTRVQSIFTPNKAYPHFGPQLEISGGQDKVERLAFADGSLVAAAAESSSKGRYMVFSSPLPFDNNGILYDYLGPHSAQGNEEILHKSIDWLLEPRQANMEVTIDTVGNHDRKYDLNMHQSYRITLTPRDKDGQLIDLGNESIILDTIEEYIEGTGYFNIPFARTGDGSYSIMLTLPVKVDISFYFHLQGADSIPTDSFFRTNFQLKNFEHQQAYGRIAFLMFFLLVVSWLFWITNEGGRKLWKLKQS